MTFRAIYIESPAFVEKLRCEMWVYGRGKSGNLEHKHHWNLRTNAEISPQSNPMLAMDTRSMNLQPHKNNSEEVESASSWNGRGRKVEDEKGILWSARKARK